MLLNLIGLHHLTEEKEQLLRLLKAYLGLESRSIDAYVRHVTGPARSSCGEREFVVACLVKNGEPYLEAYIRHCLRLGARRIFFLDNGSTDRTVELAARHPEVTVYECLLPYMLYRTEMKRWLVSRFGKNRWILLADVDEFFDYPASSRLGMADLLGYLDKNRYNAVVTQTLDLFPAGPIDKEGKAVPDFQSAHRYYDIRNIVKSGLLESFFTGYGNTASNPAIRNFVGGIRLTAFDSEVPLTKSALIRPDGGTFLKNDHFVLGARLADISCVLLHYKFLAGFPERVRRAVREGNYYNDSQYYREFEAKLSSKRVLTLKTAHSKEYRSADGLIADRFLVVSGKYRRYVRSSRSVRNTTSGAK